MKHLHLFALFFAVLSTPLLSSAQAEKPVVLVKIFNRSKPKPRQWSLDHKTLLKISQWDQKAALPLSLEEVLVIARAQVPGQKLDYISLNRPVKLDDPRGVANIFFYHIAFDDADVVVLLNGHIVPEDANP